MGTQPSLAVGGEAFGVQPVVNFLDDSGNLDSTFTGFAYATIQESLTGFESLWYDGSSTNTDNMVAVVDGRATFSGLTLNEAGSGYKLVRIGITQSSAAAATMLRSKGFSYDISPPKLHLNRSNTTILT
jgi:hypothetical protein